MDKALQTFLDNFQADVQSLVYSEGDGASFEDKFTEHCLGILESASETEGARVCSYHYPADAGKDWKINAYCLKEVYADDTTLKQYFETLDLFISHFQVDYEYSLSKDVFNKIVNQSKRFLNSALKGHIDYVDPSHEIFELIKIINGQSRNFIRINIFLLVNGTCNHLINKIEIKGFEFLSVNFHVWDINRFFRLNQSTSNREPIVIKFSEVVTDGIKGIPCLEVGAEDDLYKCYLAILPGDVLAALYKDHSSKLLESNVRAFLQQTGKINKGIRDTIRSNPYMFLPYNNGLSATAEEVQTEVINNVIYLKQIKDFQIVNGGQTTASLFHTKNKYKETDLSKISVQLKLTVIKDVEQRNIQVPYISKYANSQNKVSDLDLSSNNPFFIRLEDLSRKKYVLNPENRNHQILWFFERVNGQYREALARLTPAQQRAFREKNPSSLKFVKSDVAKYINLWELEPHFVSMGSQKNFVHFTGKIKDLTKGNLPGENFYKKLVANAIVFKAVDKLFGRRNFDAIGDTNLRSFTVAYTVAYFHYLTSNRLDLWKIYQDQTVADCVLLELKRLIVFVYNHLVTESNNSLISEYAKKLTSWQRLKKSDFMLNLESMQASLVSIEVAEERSFEKEVDDTEINNELFLVSRILGLGTKFWDGLRKYITGHDELGTIEYPIWDLINLIKKGKNIEGAPLRAAEKVLSLIDAQKLDVDLIRGLSTAENEISHDVKGIYDRMKLLSKDDWSRIFSLSEKTHLFSNLESSNVKSVQRAILSNEKIKSQPLIKAHESILKLKRFGIPY